MGIRLVTEKIIGCAYKVHNSLGPGFLEKVYENALAMELRDEQNLAVKTQHPITVFYRDRPVGEYFADLLMEEILLVEIKASLQIHKAHEAQLLHYLTATKLDHGLLINFGPSVEIRHKYRVYLKQERHGQD
jgi:GxxExxY protein